MSSKTGYRLALEEIAEKIIDYNPELVSLDDYTNDELRQLIMSTVNHPDFVHPEYKQEILVLGNFENMSAAALAGLYRALGGDEGEPIDIEPQEPRLGQEYE